jgi:RecA/RadA recombinase
VAVTALPRDLARLAEPQVRAGERRLTVADPLGALVPGGGLQRGATVAVAGVPGAGSTTVALTLAAAATSAGEWAAVVDPHGTLGARAAAAAGVELERCAVVRHVPADRWATVVAALLDGVALVVATMPMRVRASDARRLVAKARERASVLVAVGQWPVEAALRLDAHASAWEVAPSGLLTTRALDVDVQHRGHRRLRAVAG